MTTTRIPASAMWVPLAELDAAKAQIAALRRRIAELESRPLAAVSPDVTALCAENDQLRRRLGAVRELLQKHDILS